MRLPIVVTQDTTSLEMPDGSVNLMDRGLPVLPTVLVRLHNSCACLNVGQVFEQKKMLDFTPLTEGFTFVMVNANDKLNV